MSQFKTKKLISQIKVIPKKGEIKEKKGFLNTIFSFSQKQVIVSILIIFSAFFLYEAYGRIFSSLATG